ncbi:uncharacterized protein [Parasteatoda tepidariorum]|uniref:uncharacterized protein isoform X2 n=1 Tax=Parasteatoda tepidariorum TaxID=114398 RepID=UPI0039BCF283
MIKCKTGKGYKSIITVGKFSVKPEPISLSRNVTVSGNLILHKDIPEGALLKTKFYKVKYLLGLPISIPVPCVFGYGSCTVELCSYLNATREQTCPFFPTGEECECPVRANSYSVSKVVMQAPDIGPLGKYLASGHFTKEIRIVTKKASKEIACISFSGKMVA